MPSNKYKPVIGAEIHVELETKSKMFCGCKNDPFHAKKPNIYTCPVCLGLPGALPVPNDKTIDYTIMLGLALNCKINNLSIFDRKHYFYPDLPKGYQISQQAQPLCKNGHIKTSKGKVRINRVHLEEDTAKLIHDKLDGKRVSLIDFNRSGVPLVEIVTEPDIQSSSQAKEFLKQIRQIIRYLEISGADMEKGSLRLEANISLTTNQEIPDYKVEVKNINSFRFYEKAIHYEIKRQKELLDKGITPKQETRGWDENREKTVSQREKETAKQYGYFPEPDIPPLEITNKRIKRVKKSMPLTPIEYQNKLQDHKITPQQSRKLTRNKKLANYALKALKQDGGKHAEKIANLIINKKIDIKKIKPENLVSHIEKQIEAEITNEEKLTQVVDEAIEENPQAVSDYKKGKTASIGFLIGKVMEKTQGNANPQLTKKIIQKKLD